MALEPPAARSDDDRPVEVRVRELLETLRRAEESQDLTLELEIDRKLLALVAYEKESHLALMDLLGEADEEQTYDILGFLVWNPWASQSRSDALFDKIQAAARTMIADDPSVVRRQAAIRVLYRYGGGGGRKAFEFGLERLDAEPSLEVRDVLLDEMSVVGHRLGLTREEAAPFVERLRARLEDGEAWCAVALSWWSTDADDFRRIREKLATERHPTKRQSLSAALQGRTSLVSGRAEEARAVLIGLLNDPAEDSDVRSNARTLLITTFGPLDATSAEAVRRYDAEREGR
jgi:hypothetical protein